MHVLNILNPITLTSLISMIIMFICMGKGFNRQQLQAVALVGIFTLVVVYCVQTAILPAKTYDAKRLQIFKNVKANFILIFLSCMSCLWLDEIVDRFYKKRKINNSLDWFWGKII